MGGWRFLPSVALPLSALQMSALQIAGPGERRKGCPDRDVTEADPEASNLTETGWALEPPRCEQYRGQQGACRLVSCVGSDLAA